MSLTSIFNPFMIWLLHSPLHALASKNTLLITFTGSKSGRPYTTPVNYVLDGDVLHITSMRSRTWWRSLRNVTKVIVHLRGKTMEAKGEVIEDENSVAEQLKEYLQKVPQYARYFKVSLDREGHPLHEDVALAAKDRVMVRLVLTKK